MKKIIALISFLSININITSAQWSQLGAGLDALLQHGGVHSIISDASGNVYTTNNIACGTAGVICNVVKWNGHQWSVLGEGGNELNANGSISHLAKDGSGNIYAAGCFTTAGGFQNVVKWNGTNWTQLGEGSDGLNEHDIKSMVVDAVGNVYVSGNNSPAKNWRNYVAKWDGSSWATIGAGINSVNAAIAGDVQSIVTDVNGNVYAAGNFMDQDNNFYVAEWGGNSWTELGGGNNVLEKINYSYITNITCDVKNNIYATRYLPGTDGYYSVTKWDGSTWSITGAGLTALHANSAVTSLASDISGNVYAGGAFTNTTGQNYVSKWDGSSWTELGTGANALQANNEIWSVYAGTPGKVYAGGFFTNSNNEYYVAQYLADPLLPIIFTNVKASKQNKGVQFSWVAEMESDIKYYEVERSYDGIHFNKIGKVNINRAAANRYDWFDANPANGNNYYRAKAIELDGRLLYSIARYIKFDYTKTYTFYPNPIKKGETLHINLQNITANKIEIINAAGQVVYTNSSKRTGIISIPVSASFATGQYLLRVTSENKVTTQKILIQ